MAIVGVDSGSLYRRTQPKSFGFDWGRRPLGAVLQSSNTPGKLSQLLCDDDSTINIIVYYYGRPLSVSGRPCYILPMFFIFLFFMAALFSGPG